MSANYEDGPCFPSSDTLTDTWDKHRGGQLNQSTDGHRLETRDG